MKNWDIFFKNLQAEFKQTLTAAQKLSIKNVIDYFYLTGNTNTAYLLYILATNKWETMHKWVPVIEKKASPTKQPQVWKWQKRYWLTNFMGRGKTQITWKDNYAEFTPIVNKQLKKYYPAKPFVDLVNKPDEALDDIVSTIIMVEGMIQGLFRFDKVAKKVYKLSDFYNPTTDTFDAINARKVVNTIDAVEIRNIYNTLRKCYNNTPLK